MSLLPYLYSAFNEYHQTGLPPMRALVLDYPTDPETKSIDDQFMLGPSLMAAPFVDGASKRSVYFPAGVWYDCFTDERIVGGRRIEVSKTLDQMPLYVKDDTVLPVAEPLNHVAKDTVFRIHMRVYGNNPASFTLYEDDGETYDFEKGAQTQLVLSWKSSGGTLKRNGSYAKPRYEIVGWKRVDQHGATVASS